MPSDEIGLFEAMYSARAIRYFKPDPVPQELIDKVLDAAIRAPSGGNMQTWAFVVIRDPEIKRQVAEYYHEGWRVTREATPEERIVDIKADPSQVRVYRSASHLAYHMAEVPVLILACLRGIRSGRGNSMAGASIFPAVQNIILAARGLGLGAVLTTVHKLHEAEIKQLLGMPDDVETFALIPLGYPDTEQARFGRVRRRPVKEVVHYDRWGNQQS